MIPNPVEQIVPYSIESEQAVLGGVLIDPAALDDVADIVAEEDFFRRDHRQIYRAMLTLAGAGNPVDVITVAEALQALGALDDIGGMPYLGGIASGTPSSANIKAYARHVKDRSVERQLMVAAREISELSLDKSIPASEKMDHAQAKLAGIGVERGRGPRRIGESLQQWVLGLEERFTNGGAVIGVPTGFTDFDAKTGGLQRSDLVIVAGRPSMGKTSWSMNVCEYAAIQGIPTLVFSMEMPEEQLQTRSISSLGRVNNNSLRTGKVKDDAEWARITKAIGEINSLPLFIDDSAGLSVTEIRARARRMHRKEGIGLIMVDYIGLMSSPAKERRDLEIAYITKGLKALAKELNVPVIALSQLNRSLEKRTDKRPMMSDLRESGAIEQDADVIVFLYRDEVYNEDSPDKGTAEVIIAKQRNGEIGKVRLTFAGSYCRFDNMVHGYDHE